MLLDQGNLNLPKANKNSEFSVCLNFWNQKVQKYLSNSKTLSLHNTLNIEKN